VGKTNFKAKVLPNPNRIAHTTSWKEMVQGRA